MVYIIDAYNVIHKIPRLEGLLDHSLRGARDGLIGLCTRLSASRGDVTEMILVFDGNSNFRDLPQPSHPKIRLIFSETNEDADERIIEILAHLPKNIRACVVSDDNFVANQARAYAADVMRVVQLEELMKPKVKTAGKKKRRAEAPYLPPEVAHDITESYKKELGIE